MRPTGLPDLITEVYPVLPEEVQSSVLRESDINRHVR